ncbi:MAG: hypothetical protein KVP17_003684 [Porospora cf. gigantea B]|nr:MAG: hypothetical protein KVP17_003684 [Porospora cf. gigantea B]
MLRMDSKVHLMAICTPSETCRQNYRALEASLLGKSADRPWQYFDDSNVFLDYCVEAGIAAVVLCTEQSTLVDHVEACLLRGLSVLSDRIRHVQAEPRKLLQRFANVNEQRRLNGLTRLAWHTLSLFPYEDVAVALRLRLGAVGKLHSVSATFSCHPDSLLEHETVKVFRTVAYALDDAQLASVFCRSGPLDENGKASRLSGVFQLQSKSGLVPVTFVVAHSRALSVREFTFLGEQGHLTLRQAGPSWNLKVHTPGEIRAEPFPISAVQNALYTFLSQLHKNEGSQDPPADTSKSSLRLKATHDTETVTCRVHRSVEDSLVEHTFHAGLQSSLEREGACVCYSLTAC